MTCKENCLCYSVCTKFEAYAHNPKLNLPNPSECNFFKDRSKFIELPCNTGDIVYRIFENASGKVIGKSKVIGVHSKRNNPCLIIDGWEMQNFKEIGKTVFLTEEEAEQALKECEKG